LLYAHSNTLLRWSYQMGAVHEWRSRPGGGLFGGVIFVSADESRGNALQLTVARARDALTYMSENGMASNLLAITTREDVRGEFSGFPVRWVDFNAPANIAPSCAERLKE
jgi:hypothetical protein